MSVPNLVPVQSSNIKAVGHDDIDQKLYVAFKSNTVYVYLDVPAETFHALLQANSKGLYLNQNIKPKHSAIRIS